MKQYRVIWDTRAKESLKAITLYIKEESPTAAKKIRTELLKLTASLKKMPERFSIEPYLEHKGHEYRSVTKWSWFYVSFPIKTHRVCVGMNSHFKISV